MKYLFDSKFMMLFGNPIAFLNGILLLCKKIFSICLINVRTYAFGDTVTAELLLSLLITFCLLLFQIISMVISSVQKLPPEVIETYSQQYFVLVYNSFTDLFIICI